MIRLTEIQEAMLNLVGWRDGWGDNKLEPTGEYNPLTSKSGFFFQDAHSLLTLENIKQTMPKDWGTSDTPENTPTFSDYLKFLTCRSIANLIQKFIQIKQLNQETRDILEERVLFYGAANRRAIAPIRNDIVGFIFHPTQSTGVNVRIEKIGFQFTPEMVGRPFELRIGQIGSIDPEYVLELPADKLADNNKMCWFSISDFAVNDKEVGETTELILKGSPDSSEWAIYYNTEQLQVVGASPLNIGRDWSKAPCTCNRQNYDNFIEVSKYIEVYPFKTKATENNEVPYADSLCKDYHNNFGLNVQFTVGCDITDLLIRQKNLFASALQYQLAADVLREMAMNPDVRVNRNQANISRMELLYEIDGNGEKQGGINNKLEDVLKALNFSTEGLDRVCLQCRNKGVRYGTV